MGCRFMGIFAIVPATMILTVSFFVLFAIKKTEEKGLKTFGYVITGMLWFCAVVVFSAGIFVMASGNRMCCPTGKGMRFERMGHNKMPWMNQGCQMQDDKEDDEDEEEAVIPGNEKK